MNTRIASTPNTHDTSSYRATHSAQSASSATGEQGHAAPAAPASSERLPADQSHVTPHADYAFSEGAVQFPETETETETKNQPTYAGLGEIMGGIAALFSGAPSDSFSPVIEQAQKNLAERRAPRAQAPVEVDTAASDKTLKD